MADNTDLQYKIISIILGLGLASLFRQVCKDDKCRVVKGPNLKEIQKNTYKIDDKCYKYKPVATVCDNS